MEETVRNQCRQMTYEEKRNQINSCLRPEESFDVIDRDLQIGEKKACYYFIDGFCKDELMQKILQKFMDIKKDDMPLTEEGFLETQLPYVEAEICKSIEKAITAVLSGMTALLIEGYDNLFLIDARTYPARSVSEPDKDKALRGSKDGFVETIIFNTALIRRRIRDPRLRMEICTIGNSSKTDVVLCYMEDRIDKNLLCSVKSRLDNIKIDALTLNQETLAENLIHTNWFNPFPKFKYTERPDTAAAQVLEGNLILLIDNSPSALILPVSLFDITEESDDFYLPPVTGTYLRMTRCLIGIVTYLLTPVFLLLMQNESWIPECLSFIKLAEESNVPLLIQFLLLEVAIDGLKLAAVNTPSMLSTPLSIMAAIVMGEFSVKSGWFNAEVMLYMAFVALANYTQASYELGYALKFMRMITLLLTGIFNLPGFIAGLLITFIMLISTKALGVKSYLSPLLPPERGKIRRVFIRTRSGRR